MAATAPARLHAPNRRARYRIAVLASSVDDVVRSAGGWLCDQAWAGCQVMALIPRDADDRPLRILGADTLDMDRVLASRIRTVWPDTLAVAADLYLRDARVRRGVLPTIAEGMTNVVMWGDNWPTEFDGLTTVVNHRLSIAARAFKAHALAVASVEGAAGDEAFRGFDLRSPRKGHVDLLTAS